MNKLFRDPTKLMPWFIGLSVVVHLALQIISLSLPLSEWSILGAGLYVVSGILLALVAAYWLKQAAVNKSRQYFLMGAGMTVLFATFMIVGMGIGGIFGMIPRSLFNAGFFLLLAGMGFASLFWLTSPTTTKLRSGSQKLLVGSALLILFVVGLYHIQPLLPELYTEYGLPTLLRQQLITILLVLYTLTAVRFALSEWGKETFSGQWFIIGIMVVSLILLNLLLSTRPGDGYSWAGRFMLLLAAGAFIQSAWWHDRAVV